MTVPGYPWPEPIVEIDVTNEPTNATRAWTDITSYVRGGTWTRDGRIAETERTTGGSASLTLDNRPDPVTGEPFDKDNADSPFNGAGGLAWAFFVRVSLKWSGTTEVVWTGTKDELPKDRPGYGKDRTATLNAVTALKALELYQLSGLTFAQATADVRVTDVLAAVGLPAGTIDSATVSTRELPAITFAATDTTTALSHLQSVEQDERGLIFAGGDVGVSFQGCYYRADKVIGGATATIGETSGDIRYVDGAPDDNNAYMWNYVTVTTTDADSTVSYAEDSGSVAANYERRLDLTSLYDDVSYGQHEAEWYVNRYAQPPQRLPQLEILGARDPSTWATILAAANSDLFTWEGGDSSLSVFLERVQMTFSTQPGELRLRVYWDTSPSIRDVVWKMGVAGASELGLTTRLG